MSTIVSDWERGGDRVDVRGHQVWCRRVPAITPTSGNAPLLIIHGFPTCSYDWNRVVPAFSERRDVILLDLLGFGLSDKPDQRYSLRNYADGVAAVVAHFGLDHVDLVTHDLGDSVGGEILARSLEGALDFTIGQRVLTNGSIYMDLVQLTVGQQLLLALPDEANDLVGADGGTGYKGGLVGTFAPDSPVDDDEMDALAEFGLLNGGLAMLPRTIRYIEDRLAEEARFTGGIEDHTSPVNVVWGDRDPVAVHAMAERFVATRTDATLTTLEGVGHYPMVEAPERFATAVLDHLEAP